MPAALPSRFRTLLPPFLALVAIHWLSGLGMEQPHILADELGYLGNARYLSGTGPLPSMEGRAFYHFGYSLLLLPAFWLFSEPTSIYKAAIFINALLAGSLYFPLSYLLVSFARVSERTARWIALACCLYPSLVLYSSFAWSESAYLLLYASVVALFGRLLASGSDRDALLFGLLAGFLYTVHPRALPVVAITLVVLVVLALLRILTRRRFLLSASAMTAVFVVTRLVNQHLKTVGWDGGGEIYATKLPGRLLPGPDTFTLLERASGQLLYLSLATHGLFLLGLMVMIRRVADKARSGTFRQVLADPRTAIPVFIMATASGVLATSSALKLHSLHGVSGLRGGNFIHGRYNEAFAVLAIAWALAELCRKRSGNRRLAWQAIVVVAVILSLTTVVMVEIEDALARQVADTPGVQPKKAIPAARVRTLTVPGIAPTVEWLGALNLYAISFLALGSFLLVTTLTRRSSRAGLALVMLLFLFFAYDNNRHYQRPLAARLQHRLDFASEIRRLGPVRHISFDVASPQRRLLPGLQYLLPNAVFDRFDSGRGELPESTVVVAADDWPQADALGAELLVSTGRGNSLWLLTGGDHGPAGEGKVEIPVSSHANRIDGR